MFSSFLTLFNFFPAGYSHCYRRILQTEINPSSLALKGVAVRLWAWGERKDRGAREHGVSVAPQDPWQCLETRYRCPVGGGWGYCSTAYSPPQWATWAQGQQCQHWECRADGWGLAFTALQTLWVHADPVGASRHTFQGHWSTTMTPAKTPLGPLSEVGGPQCPGAGRVQIPSFFPISLHHKSWFYILLS